MQRIQRWFSAISALGGCAQLCDHRVRGFPFCQDCIVAGVELLRHHASTVTYRPKKSSPFVGDASIVRSRPRCCVQRTNVESDCPLCNLCKLLSDGRSNPGCSLLCARCSRTWLFAAVDACRTAQLMRAGLSPRTRKKMSLRVDFTEIRSLGELP